MVTIYIKQNRFYKNIDKNKNIIKIKNENNFIENNFVKIELPIEYIDCIYEDFNEDLTFNVEKYNSRKTKEQTKNRIAELKRLLWETDYQAIKYAEGEITLDNYLPIKLKRASYRAEINSLEEKIKNMA